MRKFNSALTGSLEITAFSELGNLIELSLSYERQSSNAKQFGLLRWKNRMVISKTHLQFG